MFRLVSGLTLFVAFVPPGHSVPAPLQSGPERRPTQVPDGTQVKQTPKPPDNLSLLHYTGTVTAVDKTTVTIVRPQLTETRVSDGAVRIIPALPPKVFTGSRLLLEGKNQGWGPGTTYRISDVRVGDSIHVAYQVIGGVSVCNTIIIQRRPGGRVPPAPGEKPDAPDPYHERMNAYQDLEERGIPLPRKFRPSWELPPVAPAPREVFYSIPAAKP